MTRSQSVDCRVVRQAGFTETSPFFRSALRAKLMETFLGFRGVLGVHASRVVFAASPRFCVRSLLDLFKTRIVILNPIACLVNFSRIDWDRARNRLGARHQLSVKLDRFRAFDWKFP